jgi:hypothetical protein
LILGTIAFFVLTHLKKLLSTYFSIVNSAKVAGIVSAFIGITMDQGLTLLQQLRPHGVNHLSWKFLCYQPGQYRKKGTVFCLEALMWLLSNGKQDFALSLLF